ncbi:putative efflux protein, MATE family [Butyrivibrio sp. ob235]|uniref:MATE family efflux transporter n=1 Tax=Butyrivibrio sp. ob235 TaxID=1761780 RepID=UPI0008B86D7B|nr:MATE family efflux transporter [Butyrivibrio sp. ob235]SEK80185.1 putative efflux protein, MATE family [Butyrivibrio sp. ob235]
MFSREKLMKLIIPMVIEQLLAVTVGMADMIMVSGAGEEAVSGISLVNSICVLLIMAFAAMASGGSVVVAQLIGAGDKKKACEGANQQMFICILLSGVLTVVALLFNRQILKLIYGNVDELVMKNAITYFYIVACSFPFLATYNAGAALFRVMNNAHISMVMSAIMNGINIGLNYILVFKMGMQVSGVAYATLVSRAVAATVILTMIRKQTLPVHIDKYFRFGWHPDMLRKVLSIGVPQAMENSMFQIGKLLTQSLISGFGTAAIAANACANTVEMLADIPGSAMGLALVTVVGQCVGAGRYDLARGYVKKLLKITYAFLITLNIILFILAGNIAGMYNLTELGTHYALQLIRYHSICCMAIWPLSFTIASVLRSAGDAKFTMTTSIVSMWIFRIGFAYIIAKGLGMGVLGVWIAMTIDWAFRAVMNTIRFHGHKWETKAVVKASVSSMPDKKAAAAS